MVFRKLGGRFRQQFWRLEIGCAVQKIKRHPLMACLAHHLAGVVRIVIDKIRSPQLTDINVTRADAALAHFIGLRWRCTHTLGNTGGAPLRIGRLALGKLG